MEGMEAERESYNWELLLLDHGISINMVYFNGIILGCFTTTAAAIKHSWVGTNLLELHMAEAWLAEHIVQTLDFCCKVL